MPTEQPRLGGSFSRGYSLDYDDELNQLPNTLRDVTVHDPSGFWAAGNLVTTEQDLAAVLPRAADRPAALAVRCSPR